MGWSFSKTADFFAGGNKTVSLTRQIQQEEMNPDVETTLNSEAFRSGDISREDLYKEAALIQDKFRIGLWLLGIFLSIVLCMKITSLLSRYRREDYEPDRFHCISCGRCMEYCPVKENHQQSLPE